MDRVLVNQGARGRLASDSLKDFSLDVRRRAVPTSLGVAHRGETTRGGARVCRRTAATRVYTLPDYTVRPSVGPNGRGGARRACAMPLTPIPARGEV